MRTWLVVVALAGGCGGAAYAPAPRGGVAPVDAEARSAFDALRSPAGPTRFAAVDANLYRGGQPTARQLAWLRTLGVGTVISLRDEDPAAVRAEAETAHALGMRFVHHGFNGLSAPDPALLHEIVSTMQDTGHGAVYVHCLAGRDRTSLVVALYRVWVDQWSARDAWQKESRDFGHRGWLWFRNLDHTYSTLTSG